MNDLENCLSTLKTMADHGVTTDDAIGAALSDYLAAHETGLERLEAITALDDYLKAGAAEELEPRGFWLSVLEKSDDLARIVKADGR
ncbi:hypothetical protein [Methylobacterium planeticum]|uniref:Uncharacterized protein n=1 Tax=Methylobacterium planeticum TaxID=2615211 RepID=A0A6N6MTV9_9HYPH|nr:hypothetical protein [Methylobacterium planeticum]KAB1074429.1 hypothetical protein F6X51_08690 [Methylobacterium planeticum]